MPNFPRDPETQRDQQSHGLIRSRLRRTPPIACATWQGELQREIYQNFPTPLAFTPLDCWLSQGEIIALVRSERPLLTRSGAWRLVDTHLPHRDRFLNLLGRPLRKKETLTITQRAVSAPELHRLLRTLGNVGASWSDWEHALIRHLPANIEWHGNPDLKMLLSEHLNTYDLLNSPDVPVQSMLLTALLKQGSFLHLICELQVDASTAPLPELADLILKTPNVQAMQADGWQVQSSPLALQRDHVTLLLSSPPYFEAFFDQVK